jgi:peptidoglycan/LPS O-acetylase OafA/YrhL
VLTLVAFRVTQRWAYPWFAIVGALTYPLYLVHARLGFIVFHRIGPVVHRYVLLIGTVAVMAGLAYLIHACVERPVAPFLKQRLTHAWESRRVRRGAHRRGTGAAAASHRTHRQGQPSS